ncbi:MAG: hypothetical protein WCS51_02775 [Bacilli bacterium]|jgi:hypothetical protein
MEQKEFNQFKKVIDEKYPACEKYLISDGVEFYIEPNFYTQLKFFEERFASHYPEIINELINNVKRNKKVVFTADYEQPVVYEDDFVYQEIEDITNKLKIFSGYKSRGSDYGD